jgi:Flp pilus assembly protein TadG
VHVPGRRPRLGPFGRSRRDERGAAAIEFAIIVSLLLTIVFGIIDFGFALYNLGGLREGTREGARQGVVASFGTDTSCTTTGSLPANDKALACLTKTRMNLFGISQADTRVNIQLGTGGYAVGQPLKVCTQAQESSITGFLAPFFNGKVVTSTVTMRIEQTGGSGLSSGGESSLDPNGWSCPAA